MLQRAGRYVAAGVLCHATGLLMSLIYLGNRRSEQRINVTSVQIVTLVPIVAFFLWPNLPTVLNFATWYGLHIPGETFALISIVLFAAWAVFGSYRTMRRQLQFRTWPWVWPLYIAYLIIYLLGFVIEAEGRLNAYLVAYLVAPFVTFVFVYVLLFAEPKDLVALRRTLLDCRSRRFGAFFHAMPLWAVTVPLAFLAFAFSLLSLATFDHGRADAGVVAVRLSAAYLFMMRDLGIVLMLNIGGNPRRANLAALVYLAMLYVLLPMLLRVAELNEAAFLFLPIDVSDPVRAIVAPTLQAALMWWLVIWRWRKNWGQAALVTS